MSRSLTDFVDLGEYVFQAIVVYVVVDLIAGGAIEDALVGAFSPIIGPGWTLLIRVVLLAAGAVELFAFASSLAGAAHSRLGGL